MVVILEAYNLSNALTELSRKYIMEKIPKQMAITEIVDILSGKVKKTKKAGSFKSFDTTQERTRGGTSGVIVLIKFNINKATK